MVLEAAGDRASDPAWEFLNRRSALRMLRMNATTVDSRSRNHILRLATYFLHDA